MFKYLGLTYIIGLLSLSAFFQNCGMGEFAANSDSVSFSLDDQSPIDVDINEGNIDLDAVVNFGDDAELPSHLMDLDSYGKDQVKGMPMESETKKQRTQEIRKGNEQVEVPKTGRYNFVSGQGQENCQGMVESRLGVQLECTLGGGCGMNCGIPGGNCTSANPRHYGLCVEVGENGRIMDFTKPQTMGEVSERTVVENRTVDSDKAGGVSDRLVRENELSLPPGERMITLYPFFEIRQHNHILVKDPNELSQLSDYLRLREVINIYASGGDTRAPIYRCRQDLGPEPLASPPTSKGNHFVSRQADCEGQIREQLYGYVETERKTLKHWPLYRLNHHVRRDHVLTFTPNGYQQGGYQPEGILGYVELP